MSTLADSLAARDQLPAERRFYPRVSPRAPISVMFPEKIVATLINLSENGFLVSTNQALELHSVHRVALALGSNVAPIGVSVHTVWSDPTWPKSGLQFLDLSESDRSTLRSWAEEQCRDESVSQTSVCAAPSATYRAQPAAATEGLPDQPSSMPRVTAVIPTRTHWLSALQHHQRIPVRYFWASFAATLFLGATWAAVEGFLPDKILKSPVAHLQRARHPSDSTPPLPPPPAPVEAPVTSAPLSASRTSPEAPSAVVPALPPRTSTILRAPPKQPLRQKPPSESQPRTSASRQTVARSPQPTTSSTNTSVVASGPGKSPAVSNNSNSPPLSPRSVAPNPAATPGTTHTEGATARPQPTAQPSALHSAAPTAPAPVRIVPTPAYSTQVLEIPSMASSAYVQLPGERVLRSPSLTMHIQRSVWVKASHWFWHSRKKVDLGELAAHTEPKMPTSLRGAGKPAYGSVTVLATIAKNGKISSVRPLYGSAQLLPNVSAALRGWRYQPTYVDGQPSETLARIEVDFHAPLRPDAGFER